MNVAKYGQGLREIADKNLYALAELEREKQQAKWDSDRASSKAKATSIGTMVGGLVGAGKGFYNARKDDYEQNQRAEMADYENEMFRRGLESRVTGKPIDPSSLPPKPSMKPYNFLDDMAAMFEANDLVSGGGK